MERTPSRSVTRSAPTAFLMAEAPGPEARAFVHKKIGGFIVKQAAGFIPGGRTALDLGKTFFGGGGGGAQQPCTVGFEPDGRGGCVRILSGFAPQEPPRRRGMAMASRPRAPRGSAEAPDFFGDAVMGQYGVALEPAFMTIERTVCPDGMLVATDGLCYNRSQISNKERMWPKGRRPLLTGGDLNAISKAKRAATRLHNATASVRAIGLLKAPPRRRKKS